jgi:hypothetical protein
MGMLRIQVTIPRTTGLPEDAITNTWHYYKVGAASGAEVLQAVDYIGDFYSLAVGGFAVHQFLSNLVDPHLARFKVYDLADPEPRAPIHDSVEDLGASGGAGFPAEVALCLSYQGDQVSGEPQRQKRGRIYIGPMVTAESVSAAGDIRPDTPQRATLAGAAARLAGTGTADFFWAVNSEVFAGPTKVTNGWVDNAYDTQRRRGSDATSRDLWVAA